MLPSPNTIEGTRQGQNNVAAGSEVPHQEEQPVLMGDDEDGRPYSAHDASSSSSSSSSSSRANSEPVKKKQKLFVATASSSQSSSTSLPKKTGYATIGDQRRLIVVQRDVHGNVQKNMLKVTRVEEVSFPVRGEEIKLTWNGAGSGFSNAERKVPVLEEMDAWKLLHDFTVITGRNGAGKSKFLKYISEALFCNENNDNVFFMSPELQHQDINYLREGGHLFDILLRDEHIAHIEKAIAKKIQAKEPRGRIVMEPRVIDPMNMGYETPNSDYPDYLENVINSIYSKVGPSQDIGEKFDDYIQRKLPECELKIQAVIFLFYLIDGISNNQVLVYLLKRLGKK